MKTLLNLLLPAVLAALMLSSCNTIETSGSKDVYTRDSEVTRDYVTLHGRISSTIDKSTVTEVGFLISEKEKFSDNDAKKLAAPMPDEQDFTLTATMDDLDGKRDVMFYYKAYIITNGKLASGERKSFRTEAIKVTGLSLNQTGAGLKLKETLQLTATVTPPNATHGTVKWTSSNDQVATVSQEGLVKAIEKGKATITAQAEDFTATCDVGVLGTMPAGAVDMGLSVYWAAKAIPSTKANTSGPAYISWGETEEKDHYAAGTYKYYKYGYTKYNNTDKLRTLQPEDDAATAILGSAWRTPTKAEWEELILNSTHTRTATNFTSNINSEKIEVMWIGFKVNSEVKGGGDIGFYMTSDLTPDNTEIPILVSITYNTPGAEIGKQSYSYTLSREHGYALIAVSEGL